MKTSEEYRSPVEHVLSLLCELIEAGSLLCVWEGGGDRALDGLIDSATGGGDEAGNLVILRSPWEGGCGAAALKAVVEAVAREKCGLVIEIDGVIPALRAIPHEAVDWRRVVAGALRPYVDQLAEERYIRSYRHNLPIWLSCDLPAIEECVEKPNDQGRRRALQEQLDTRFGWRKACVEMETLIDRLVFLGAGSETMSKPMEMRAELSRLKAGVQSLSTNAASEEVESVQRNVLRLMELARS